MGAAARRRRQDRGRPVVTAAVDTMRLARDERADLADLLSTLTPAQWKCAVVVR